MRILREMMEPGKGTAEIYLDEDEKFRFRIKANNYKIIAVGEGYNSKQACLNGIRSLIRSTHDLEVLDLTV